MKKINLLEKTKQEMIEIYLMKKNSYNSTFNKLFDNIDIYNFKLG